MKIITTCCIKGGSGKTSTALALTQAALASGLRTLAVDTDMQGNFSSGLKADRTRAGTYSVLSGSRRMESVLQRTEQGADVSAGGSDLSSLQTKRGSAARLSKALLPLKDEYDVCIIDSAPQLSESLFNAIMAADILLVCTRADIYSLSGMYSIIDTAKELRPDDQLRMRTVITDFDGRSNAAKYCRDEIIKRADETGAPVLGIIRHGIAVQEAQIMQESLFEYAPKSKPASDYAELFKKVMEVN